MIEVNRGQLVAIHLRRLPKIVSAIEVASWGRWQHERLSGDRCWLYYKQPWRFPNFLALQYMISARDCTLATLHRTLELLDEVARVKQTDAIVCDVWNWRISDRLLAREGWQSHRPSRWHRHYIKRFYGVYPNVPANVPEDAAAMMC
jgi:hypothetical protein